MIFALLTHARACVRFVPVSMRLVHRDVDSRYGEYYIRGQPWEIKPVVSECRMRLPHVYRLRSRGMATRKDQSPFEGASTQREDRVPSLYRYSWKLCARASLDWRVIKFRLSLFKKDVESTFSLSSLPSLADISRSCEVYFC